MTGARSALAGVLRVAIAGAVLIAATFTISGCGPHGRLAIPDKADRLGSGKGINVVTVTTTRWGKLHLLDRDDNDVIWAGEAHAGDVLVVDGKNHKVTLNGQTVTESVRPEHHYVIFFSHPD